MKSDFTDPRPAKLMLPPEFILRCEINKTTPEIVLGRFIADLCFANPDQVERKLATAYYEKAVVGRY